MNDKGCFNCGADTDHFVIVHGVDGYSCETIEDMDSEQYGVMMGWIN